jgi:hypothetical protein
MSRDQIELSGIDIAAVSLTVIVRIHYLRFGKGCHTSVGYQRQTI